MDDEMLELTSRNDAEVVRRIEAFADLRLSPSLAARARMRSAVMDAAQERSSAMSAEAAAATARVPVAPFERTRRPAWRRPAVAFAAAALTLAMVAGSAMASTAGGPLYGARLWAETVTLPASGTPRAQAEAQRLGQRLEEIQRASVSGDEGAAEAALSAYASILAEARSGTAGDPAAEATLKTALARHVVVLTALADRAPAQARAALDRAVASGTIVLDSLTGDDGSAGGGGSGGNGAAGGTGNGTPGGDGNGANNGNPGAPAGAGASNKPDQGAHPAATPQPPKGKPTDKPVKPAATHGPGKTGQPGNGHHGRPTDSPGASGDNGTTP